MTITLHANRYLTERPIHSSEETAAGVKKCEGAQLITGHKAVLSSINVCAVGCQAVRVNTAFPSLCEGIHDVREPVKTSAKRRRQVEIRHTHPLDSDSQKMTRQDHDALISDKPACEIRSSSSWPQHSPS